MTPLEILRRRASAEGGAALLEWVRGLAGRACARSGAPVRIPVDAQDDAVAEVAYRLVANERGVLDRLEVGDAPDEGEANRRITRYVRVMLGNWWLDEARRHAHHDEAPPELVDPGPAPDQDLRDARRVFERGVELAVARAQSPDLASSLRELDEIGLGERTMDELVEAARALEPGTPWQRLRDRIQRRHSRAREALLAVADELGAYDAAFLRDYVAIVLVRRHSASDSLPPRRSSDGDRS